MLQFALISTCLLLHLQVDEVIEQRPPAPEEAGTLPGGGTSPASVY